jgi:hypothetical protein
MRVVEVAVAAFVALIVLSRDVRDAGATVNEPDSYWTTSGATAVHKTGFVGVGVGSRAARWQGYVKVDYVGRQSYWGTRGVRLQAHMNYDTSALPRDAKLEVRVYLYLTSGSPLAICELDRDSDCSLPGACCLTIPGASVPFPGHPFIAGFDPYDEFFPLPKHVFVRKVKFEVLPISGGHAAWPTWSKGAITLRKPGSTAWAAISCDSPEDGCATPPTCSEADECDGSGCASGAYCTSACTCQPVSPFPEGTFTRTPSGSIYVTAGRSPVHISSCEPWGTFRGCPSASWNAPQDFVDALQRLYPVPTDGTRVRRPDGLVFEMHCGRADYAYSCVDAGGCAGAIDLDSAAIDRLMTGRGCNDPDAWPLDWIRFGDSHVADAPGAASWGPNRLDLFARGNDNGVYHKWYAGQDWSAWEKFDGLIGSQPAVASWGPDRLDVFAKGALDNNMYHKWYDEAGGWRPWENMGGQIQGAPAVVSRAPGTLDLAVWGIDNALYYRRFDANGWSDWRRIGGVLSSSPAIASMQPDRLDFFVRGVGVAGVHHMWWDASGMSDWEYLGGELMTAPAAISKEPGRIDLFTLGSGNSPYHRVYTAAAGWSNWEFMRGKLGSAIGVSSWGPNRLDIFGRGVATDDAIYQRKWVGP